MSDKTDSNNTKTIIKKSDIILIAAILIAAILLFIIYRIMKVNFHIYHHHRIKY